MTDPTVRRRAAWWSLAVATALLVAGCSAGGDGPSSPDSTAASSPPASSGTPAAAGATPSATAALPSSGSTTPAPPPSAPASPGQALASRQFTVASTYTAQARVRMRIDILELKRRGDLLDMTATLTNLEQDGSRDLRWQVGSRFAGTYRRDMTTGDVFSGGTLTDREGKKRYLVAADSGGHCVCTEQLSGTFVGAGQSIELSATYAAPPVSTTKLDVGFTSLGTFRDLPIS